MILRKLIKVFFMAVSCHAGIVSSQTLPTPHLKVNRFETVVEFQTAQRMVTQTVIEREALTAEGAQSLTKYTTGFNSALEKLEIVEAYTLKKSGQKIIVEKDAVTAQKGLVSQGLGVTLPEWEQRQISYPSLDVGDRVYIKTIRTTEKPPLKGWSSMADFAWPSADFDQVIWTIKAPSNMPLYISSSLNPSVSTTSADQTVRSYMWNWKGRVMDANPANTRIAVPFVLASTLESHEQVGRLFAEQVIAKAVPTDELRTLVQTQIKGLDTDEKKAKALYDWVRKEIKYVALYLSNGGWEPHDVAHILGKRYGDCKDHVTLLYAMLSLAGISSQPVLINTLNEYQLDALPVVGAYNHTILYIPSLQRFIDPTASSTPFHAVPWQISGKPVIVADAQKGYRAQVPSIRDTDNTLSVKTKFDISSDGSAKGTIDLNGTGYAATVLQDRLAQIPAGFNSAALDKILQGSNLNGKGFLTFPTVNRDIQVQTASFELDIKNLLREPTAGSLVAHPGINMPIYILNNMGNHNQESREFGYFCLATRLIEEFAVQFDSKFKIMRPPTDLTVGIEGIRFTASYQFANNRLSGTRELVISKDGQYCSAQEYDRRKTAMRQIVRHLRAPILYSQD